MYRVTQEKFMMIFSFLYTMKTRLYVYVVCGKSVVYPILINQKNSTLNHCSNSFSVA